MSTNPRNTVRRVQRLQHPRKVNPRIASDAATLEHLRIEADSRHARRQSLIDTLSDDCRDVSDKLYALVAFEFAEDARPLPKLVYMPWVGKGKETELALWGFTSNPKWDPSLHKEALSLDAVSPPGTFDCYVRVRRSSPTERLAALEQYGKDFPRRRLGPG